MVYAVRIVEDDENEDERNEHDAEASSKAEDGKPLVTIAILGEGHNVESDLHPVKVALKLKGT